MWKSAEETVRCAGPAGCRMGSEDLEFLENHGPDWSFIVPPVVGKLSRGRRQAGNAGRACSWRRGFLDLMERKAAAPTAIPRIIPRPKSVRSKRGPGKSPRLPPGFRP